MKQQNSADANGPSDRIVERIIESHNGNNGYNRLKDIVFVAVVLAAGSIIWAQQRALDQIELQIAVLNLKCSDKPLHRGPSE